MDGRPPDRHAIERYLDMSTTNSKPPAPGIKRVRFRGLEERVTRVDFYWP
jgi:hypothetical protein